VKCYQVLGDGSGMNKGVRSLPNFRECAVSSFCARVLCLSANPAKAGQTVQSGGSTRENSATESNV